MNKKNHTLWKHFCQGRLRQILLEFSVVIKYCIANKFPSIALGGSQVNTRIAVLAFKVNLPRPFNETFLFTD